MTREGDVRRLLAELTAAGRAQEASQFHATFELLGWDSITDAQVERVRSLIPTPPQSVADAPGPETWSPVQSFRPWIESIRFGLPLLEELDRLANAHDFDSVARGLRVIFVDLLRYEAVGRNESSRLSSRGTISQLLIVARSGDFTVSLVEMVHPRAYASTTLPIFQLHPRGVVIEWYPLRRIVRWSARVVRGASSTIESRTFVGRALDDSVHDNLITWARRLDLLTPRFNDDARALSARAARAIASAPTVLLGDWEPPLSSRPASYAVGALPGVAWEELGGYGGRSFLQPSGRRWHWGLQRVLRDRFPLQLGRRPRINFVRYVVENRLRTEEESVSQGLTWADRATLHFALESTTGLIALEVPVTVPVIGEDVRFVVRGETLRHVARVGRDGAFNAESTGPIEEEVGFEESLLGFEPSDPMPLLEAPDDVEEGALEDESEDDDDAELEIELDPGSAIGVDPGALLAIAVHRKLGGLVRRWWRDKDRDTGDVEWFFAGIASLRDYSGEFCLASVGWLRSALEPVRFSDAPVDTLQITRTQHAADEHRVPAWACLDVSADLPPGCWYPVAAARLNPAGGLSIPIADADAILRFSSTARSGLEINGRQLDCAAALRPWWIASPLAPYADAPAGSVERAARLAMVLRHSQSVSSSSRVLRTHLVPEGDPRLTLFGSRSEAPVISTRVSVRLPAVLEIDAAPVLRVEIGAEVEPGEVWLEYDARAWTGRYVQRRKSPTRELVESVFKIGPDSAAVENWRVPVGVSGTVVEAHLIPSAPRGLVSGWTATIRVTRRRPAGPGWAWLANGRAVPLDHASAEEAPFDQDGVPVEAALTGVASGGRGTSTILFDPSSGELIEHAEVSVLAFVTWSPPFDIVGPDPHLAFRLRDGEGIPSSSSSPGLSAQERLWWRARDPEGASAMDAVEAASGGGDPPFWAHLRAVILASSMSSSLERRPQSETLDPDAESNGDLEQDLDEDFTTADGATADETRGHFVPKTPWTENKLLNQTMVRPHLLQSSYQYRELAPLSWRCECGTVAGMRSVDEYCPSCKTVVAQRASELPLEKWPSIALPEPILHPWHADTAAALLGLTRVELTSELADVGPEKLQTTMSEAASNPRSAIHERLSTEGLPAPLARALRSGARALDNLLDASGGSVPDVWLYALPILHPALHPCGLPDRVHGVVTSDLRAAYMGVVHASRRLSRFLIQPSTPLVLLRLAREQLWLAVERLFGEPEGRAENERPSTLAGLAHRLWPLTRAARLRSSPPGVFAIAAQPTSKEDPRARELRLRTHDPDAAWVNGSPDDWVSTHVAPSAEIRIGVVRFDGVVWCPALPNYRGERGSQTYWAERAAMARLCQRRLPELAATIAVGTRCMGMSGAEQRRTLALACTALEGPGAAPSRFLQLLERTNASSLPPSRDVARAKLRRVVSTAFPGPDAAPVTEALTIALTSWFSVDAGNGDDIDWTFDSEQSEPPAGSVRVLPPWSLPVWDRHSDYAELVSPLLRWSCGHPRPPDSEFVRALTGFPTTVVSTPRYSSPAKPARTDEAIAAVSHTDHAYPVREDAHGDDESYVDDEETLPALADMDDLLCEAPAPHPIGPETVDVLEAAPARDELDESAPVSSSPTATSTDCTDVLLLNTTLHQWLTGGST